MVKMYEDIVSNVSETVEIDGYPFYAEEITGNESFNRRESNRQSILSGTEIVTKGKYISREFSFTTSVHIPTNKAYVYDKIFSKMVNKTCRVISPYMGKAFNAEIIIQKNAEESTPNDLKLEIQIIEIPNSKSNIPGENFTVPKLKKIVKKDKNTNKKDTAKNKK